jgi:biopolymer transport protein ExbD
MQVQEDKPYDDINITPMLDLAYVLLVIFILMCTASVQGLNANLPHASNSPSKAPPKHKLQAIVIDNGGAYRLNGDLVTLDQLKQKLTEAKAADPDVPAVIRGNSGTHYQAVMDAIAVVASLGITEVGLATQPAGSK